MTNIVCRSCVCARHSFKILLRKWRICAREWIFLFSEFLFATMFIMVDGWMFSVCLQAKCEKIKTESLNENKWWRFSALLMFESHILFTPNERQKYAVVVIISAGWNMVVELVHLSLFVDFCPFLTSYFLSTKHFVTLTRTTHVFRYPFDIVVVIYVLWHSNRCSSSYFE